MKYPPVVIVGAFVFVVIVAFYSGFIVETSRSRETTTITTTVRETFSGTMNNRIVTEIVVVQPYIIRPNPECYTEYATTTSSTNYIFVSGNETGQIQTSTVMLTFTNTTTFTSITQLSIPSNESCA